jgi:hypothetical protein
MARVYYHQANDSAESNIEMEQRELIEDVMRPLTVTSSAEGLMLQQDITRTNSFVAYPEEATAHLGTDTRASQLPDHIPFKVDRFPNKKDLVGLFPRINDNEKTSLRIRLSKRNQALLLQIALIGIIFATNLFILLYASSKYPSRNGVGLLYAGDCDQVRKSNRWLHLLINVLSTGMLSASSFCMQLQASPTRADVDKAHRRNIWLDIGAPSLRNLRHIGGWRLGSCIVMAFSSLPIHLM